MYSLLEVFTVEGWYEIPELLAEREVLSHNLLGLRIYFASAMLICCILGFLLQMPCLWTRSWQTTQMNWRRRWRNCTRNYGNFVQR